MRTTKRFTPQVLERFHRQGRGLGTFEHYIPWHGVSRGDPASCGRSHLQMWNKRLRELLSDHEWVILLFALMLPNLVDVREQFPLSLYGDKHETSAYSTDVGGCDFPGTLAIAKTLGIRHPMTTGDGDSANWVMTSDLVLVLRNEGGAIELLSIAVKPTDELGQNRKKELLAIERDYWAARGVTWLLITPAQYNKEVGLNLRMNMPWMLGEPAPASAKQVALKTVADLPGHSLTFIIDRLEHILGEKDLAQRAFWQAVLSGTVRLNLRRGWRPHLPVTLLPEEAFIAQNPVASRRSAWS